MNKKIVSSLVVLGVVALPVLALAAFNSPTEPGGTITNIDSLWAKVLSFIWPVVIGLSVIMVIVAAITFMTAGGDPEKVASARQALIWAIVGIVVAILAYSIPNIITVAIGG